MLAWCSQLEPAAAPNLSEPVELLVHGQQRLFQDFASHLTEHEMNGALTRDAFGNRGDELVLQLSIRSATTSTSRRQSVVSSYSDHLVRWAYLLTHPRRAASCIIDTM